MEFKDFFCGMCKNKRPLEMKTTMILIKSDEVKHGNICSNCNESLKDIFNSRQLQSKQITLMGELGVKIWKNLAKQTLEELEIY